MSAHRPLSQRPCPDGRLTVYRYRNILQRYPWDFTCGYAGPCDRMHTDSRTFPTHAEALAAAWEHIKEHS